MQFVKMHGLGNDYVYINCFKEEIKNPQELAKIVSDRHFGIGSDGLILICPSETVDIRMRIFNADGSEAQMCGNGIRCVAKYAHEHGLAESAGPFNIPNSPSCPASLKVETKAGILTVGLITDKNNKVIKACVNMGQPILTAKDIPVKLNCDTVINKPITVSGETLSLTAVSMGNPHAVFFCKDVDSVELGKIGPAVENHEIFPERTNVHFVQLLSQNRIKIRTWERGSGITMACGTGTCACCVAAVLTRQGTRSCTASLPGGQLDLNWCQEDNCVYMSGPAVEVFEGDIQL
ncbi:MAG: diaminopimelate epimerase [Planctomycetota bacterium]|jgi:diaminopimelate epimerase